MIRFIDQFCNEGSIFGSFCGSLTNIEDVFARYNEVSICSLALKKSLLGTVCVYHKDWLQLYEQRVLGALSAADNKFKFKIFICKNMLK